jgi:uncharacterized membrane protein YfcA
VSGLAASPFGALIGVLMGAFGGGGSLLAVPLLVFVVGQDVREAQATSLVIVIVAALVALHAYAGADNIRLRAGIAFGLAAGASALLGSLVNRALDPDALLLAFSPVMVLGAVAMVSDRGRRPADFRPWKLGIELGSVARVVGYGLLVGWIIGLFGVGGGFVIVPVMVLGLRFSMAEAVATSLLVICIGSAFALVDRISSGDVEWAVAIPFSIAAGLGAIAGHRLAQRLGGEGLRRAFAAVLVVVAVYTAVRSGGALLSG